MRVRGARPRDARSLARLVEGVAREPQPTLLVLPGEAAANGVKKLALGVFPENTRALAFCERHGFAREGSRRAHYRSGEQYHDEVLMARFLTPLS